MRLYRSHNGALLRIVWLREDAFRAGSMIAPKGALGVLAGEDSSMCTVDFGAFDNTGLQIASTSDGRKIHHIHALQLEDNFCEKVLVKGG